MSIVGHRTTQEPLDCNRSLLINADDDAVTVWKCRVDHYILRPLTLVTRIPPTHRLVQRNTSPPTPITISGEPIRLRIPNIIEMLQIPIADSHQTDSGTRSRTSTFCAEVGVPDGTWSRQMMRIVGISLIFISFTMYDRVERREREQVGIGSDDGTVLRRMGFGSSDTYWGKQRRRRRSSLPPSLSFALSLCVTSVLHTHSHRNAKQKTLTIYDEGGKYVCAFLISRISSTFAVSVRSCAFAA